jgi:hypothetical protein
MTKININALNGKRLNVDSLVRIPSQYDVSKNYLARQPAFDLTFV